MRAVLKLFPRPWRERYGDDFVDQLDDDPRRVTKWIETVRSAAGLRWLSFRGSDVSIGVALVAALALALGCDLTLGIGMDERIDVDLLQHWWAAPIAAVFIFSATVATGSVVAVLGDSQRRRSLLVLMGGLVAGSFAGTALLATVSFDLAAVGAGIGLVMAMAASRALLRSPFGRADLLLVAAVPMIVALGWRSASSPAGPLVLVVVTAALMATRARPHPVAS